MKISNLKNLAVLLLSVFAFTTLTSVSVAQAKVKHYNVTPIVFGGEKVKNIVTEISAFSCPYCAKTFKNDFDNYMKLVKKKRLKFIYVPAIIHGDVDVKTNQIFYLFPKDKQLAMLRLIYNTRDSWVSAKDPVASLVKIVENNTGLSSKLMYQAFKDQEYAKEINKMSDNYFAMYKATYTPSYILNGKLIGGSDSYAKVIKALK